MTDQTHHQPGSFDLTDRVALITGAGSRTDGIGNGRAASILMAQRGAKVLVIDAVLANAQTTVDMIEKEGGSAVAFEANVAEPKDCEAAAQKALDQWGRIDILVNNVGIGGPAGTAVDVDLEAWDHAMRVNVTSMMLMAKYCVPHMAQRGQGAIVNIASVAGITGGHPSLLYPTSKGAVVNMTRAMAAHHGAQGIRVNCIAPGMVYTPMVYSRGMTPEQRELRKQRSLLQTEGSGWDVGQAVAYLVSDAAKWVTGIIMPVDAGASAGSGRLPIPPSDGKKI